MGSEEFEKVGSKTTPSPASRAECLKNTVSSNVQADNLVVKREPIAIWRLMVILAWYGMFPFRHLGHEAEANSKVFSIGVGLFLSLMDTTVVATMLIAITEDFSGFHKAPWVILAYTLSYVGKKHCLQPRRLWLFC